jgi:RNA polymerase sigma-70 factor (ECF subfamily)
MLGSTASSVHSALKRARAGLRSRLRSDRGSSPSEERIVAEFVRAWKAADLDALLALLTDDVFVSMPPMPFEYEGLDAAAGFFASIFRSGRQFDLVPTRANAQPAFGAYVAAPDGTRPGTGLFVLGLTGSRIGALTHFDATVLPRFGLPLSLPGGLRSRAY